ncbi:hypothetical protein ACQP2F_36310 [Actinoplanes sp. CA-030573]|uniref:hypothetical protein n=1 Tax=Actinoplanes sp. CA-030573 TaxID=3239898 RepID=UPI003D8A8C56
MRVKPQLVGLMTEEAAGLFPGITFALSSPVPEAVMRPRFVFVPCFLLALAACSGHSGGAKTAAPPAADATTAAAPAATTSKATATATGLPEKPAGVSTAAKAKPSGSGDPRSGTQYAILVSSKLSARQITYDLIEWYDGKEAVKACAEDSVKPAENDYCTGYYSRNNNKKLRTLTVSPDAPIRVGPTPEAKSVDLKTFLREVVNGSVITFDVDANRIMRLDQVYLP